MAEVAPPIVSLREVEKRYGSVSALDGLSLEVEAGRIFGLVGPDGAGKTTTLELLCGLRAPGGGEIRVLGLDPALGGRRLASQLGFVSQDFTLYGGLTVEENLDFFAEIRRVPQDERQDRKDRLLSFARLHAFRDRRADRLSGGMKKKLALCCSLVHEPRLLVLDEPTTGVDPVSRRELWEIVFGFLEAGVTVVVSTPYMDEAEQCHRVGLIAEGRLLALGAPDDLRDEIEGQLVLVRGRPLRKAEALAREVPGWVDGTRFGDRLHVQVRQREASLPALRRRLEEGGVEVDEIREITPTLEDIFLSHARRLAGGDDTRGRSRVQSVFGDPRRSTSEELAVEARGLERRFGPFVAVNGIDLEVRRGGIFGFLGPNGAGKTTTIRMLCGLLRPTAGSVRVAGIDVRGRGRELRSRVGYMSQRFSLYPDLTVRENLRFFGGLYGVPPGILDERIGWVTEMAGLEGREDVLTRELSGGWKQRLALGSATLHDPDVLFLDEPTSGVDPASRKRFWELIYLFAERGTTVFVTTHYMDEAEHCHRIALVYRGRIIARNSPQGLRRDMRAGSLLEVECDRPLAAVRAAKGLDFVWEVSLFGKNVHILVDDADRDARPLGEALGRAGIAVEALRPVALSLEDLFVLFVAMHDQRVKAGGNDQ
jgi:ABC-2 type transport system ATP-binding protein